MKLSINLIFLLATVLFTAVAFADPAEQPAEPTDVGSIWVNQTIINQRVLNYQNQTLPGTLPLASNPQIDPWVPLFQNNSGADPLGGAFGNFKFRNGASSINTDPRIDNLFSDGFNIVQTRDINQWNIDLNSIRPFEIDISNPSSVYSCSAPQDEVEILANAVNWSGCYADRRSYVTEPNAADEALLTRDLEVCTCLRSSPVEAVQNVMSQNFALNKGNTSAFSDRVRNGMNAHWQQYPDELNEEYSDTMNSFLFQANVVSRGEDPMFVGIMSQNMFGIPSPGTPVFESTENGHRIHPRREDQNSLLRDEAYPPGQCISPIEYLALRQLPNDPVDGHFVKEDMGHEPSNANDWEKWDYNKLQTQYNNLMALSVGQRVAQRDEILKLKAKLKYLNRNPMIKYIMGASAVDLDILTNASGNADEIREVFNTSNFSDLKREMYTIMSQVKGNCDSACINNYHNSLKNFFDGDQNRILLASLEAHKDSLRRMNNKVNVTDYMSGNVSTPKQSDIVAEFRRNYGMRAPDECNAGASLSSSDAIGCLDIYSAYCRTLDKYEPQIQNMSGVDPAILDNLDQLTADDLNTDIRTNKDFEEFNNAICNTPRDGGILNLGGEFTFFTYKDHICEKTRVPQCDLQTPEDYAYFRQGFDRMRRPSEKNMGGPVFDLYSKLSGLLGTGQMSEAGVEALRAADAAAASSGAGGPGSINPFHNARRYVEGNRRRRYEASQNASLNESVASTAKSSNTPNYSNATTVSNSRRAEVAEESVFNYSNVTAGNAGGQGNSVAQNVVEPQRVQDMDQERRQELLQDWEQEYNTWKERYGSDKTPATVARDSELKTEISTLRALLDQQKQISDQQYQLLNDAIAARTRLEQENVARTQERERSESSGNGRTSGRSSAVVSRSAMEDDISRAPASVPDQQFNTSGATGGGSSSSASISGSSSGNSAALGSSGSSDSVAREEAKLVNLRRFSDGSIIIESTGSGSGSSLNAITVPVSDEQYRILQTNPQGLNLGQIERSIPQDQIAQLERNGEIILLLQNGQNPPFEVKVEKKDNRLVYSVRDSSGGSQVPVRRVHLRSSLENLTRQLTSPVN